MPTKCGPKKKAVKRPATKTPAAKSVANGRGSALAEATAVSLAELVDDDALKEEFHYDLAHLPE